MAGLEEEAQAEEHSMTSEASPQAKRNAKRINDS
jgi:hypothetical protein